MELYINFNHKTGISISSESNSKGGTFNKDVAWLVNDIKNGYNSICPFDGALDTLLNHSWSVTEEDIVQDLIEVIEEFTDKSPIL